LRSDAVDAGLSPNESSQTNSLRYGEEVVGLNDSESSQTNSLRYGIRLNPIHVESRTEGLEYKYVCLKLNREQRYADLTIRGPRPESDLPSTPSEIQKL